MPDLVEEENISGLLRLRLRRAVGALDGAARQEMADFVRATRNPDGGYRGRDDTSDLYYTSFALELLVALDTPDDSPQLAEYLRASAARTDLSLIDRVCLLRSLTFGGYEGLEPSELLEGLESYRSADGGYSPLPAAARSTAYAPYLISLAYAGFNLPPPQPERLVAAVSALALSDGGFANDDSLSSGATPPTAAALVLLHHLVGAAPQGATDFLLRRYCADGGFTAVEGAPVADLLSTATALHALRAAGVPLASLRESCLGFVEERWRDNGGFCAHALDAVADCEYTFYGLLALGNLLL